jgi:DNA-binding MarR family transcriptional regulator
LQKIYIVLVKKVIERSGISYYRTHLEVINPLLPIQMTRKEIEVLSFLIKFREDLRGKLDDLEEDVYRLYLRKKLGMTPAALHNHIKSLVDKGAILDSDSGEVNNILLPGGDSEEYYIKIKKV